MTKVDNSTMRPRPGLVRANTDYGPRNASPSPVSHQPKDDEHWELRHGYEEQYNSEEYLQSLSSVSLSICVCRCMY